MAATSNDTPKTDLPDPQEVAKTYAQVAERASKLLGDHVQRQLKRGITPPADELGIAQAFMDMTSRLLSNPYKLAQAQIVTLKRLLRLKDTLLKRRRIAPFAAAPADPEAASAAPGARRGQRGRRGAAAARRRGHAQARTRIASTSTRAPRGRPATWMVERAGNGAVK